MDELSVEIAGLRSAVVTRDRDVLDVVRDRYKGFLSPGTPDWRIEIDLRQAAGHRSDGDVLVSRDGERARFVIKRWDFVGTADLAERRASATFAGANEYSIDSFLRILYSLALVEAHGLVVHAASLIRNGRAHLFSGPSGAGKTTLARLSPDATLLSDELSIVRLADGRARCHGTPFWGELHHGSRHAVEAITPRRALERLLPNVLFFARDPELTGRVLEIAADLVESVPCFDLSFRLDPGFWEVIDRA